MSFRTIGSSRNVGWPTKKKFLLTPFTSHFHHYFDISMHALIARNVATENDTLETFCGLAVVM